MTNSSKCLGYHNNINKEYLTDGNDSHHAPSDHTISEYVVSADHIAMVIFVIYIDIYICKFYLFLYM